MKLNAQMILSVGLLMLSFAGLLCGVGVAADGKADVNPLNPLAVIDDPFAGEYEGNGMSVVVREASKAGQYVGEFTRGNKTYPMTAKRDGDTLNGSFTVGEKSYQFYLKLEDDTLVFLTPLRLKRKQSADPARNNSNTKPTIGAKPNGSAVTDPIKGTGLETTTLKNLNWRRFGPGAFVVYENQSSENSVAGPTAKLIFDGMKGGNVMLQSMETVKGFQKYGELVPVFRRSQTISELNFKKIKTRPEKLILEDTTLDCEVTTYLFVQETQAVSTKAEVEIWRCKQIDLPAQSVEIVGGRIVIGSNVVVVKSHGSALLNTGKTDYRIKELKRVVQVGESKVTVATFVGNNEKSRPTSSTRSTQIVWVSNQVPGGIVQMKATSGSGIRKQTITQRAIAFGVKQ
jgi:hypothetical protein